MASTQELRILCFGASITAGSHTFGLKHHPYATRLKTRLQSARPSQRITVDLDGLPGDFVMKGGEYSSRLDTHFDINAPKKYDWLIFQGGGNDLLRWAEEPHAIFEEMRKLWQRALQGGAKVMALTVTDTEDQRAPTRERYSQLNRLIVTHRQENFYVADVFSRICFADMPDELRKNIWDDGLHFKPAGYDMLGDARFTFSKLAPLEFFTKVRGSRQLSPGPGKKTMQFLLVLSIFFAISLAAPANQPDGFLTKDNNLTQS
ncbi:MAG: hypothetical protein Q9223_006474, partial [Gallowayella weberi]